MKLAQLINPVPGVHTTDNGIATIKGFEWIFNNIVFSIIAFAGIALFVMLLVGGFKYLTSAGSPESVAAAQKTLTYALIGMVLVALSFLILFLIQTFTGANVTVFNVTVP